MIDNSCVKSIRTYFIGIIFSKLVFQPWFGNTVYYRDKSALAIEMAAKLNGLHRKDNFKSDFRSSLKLCFEEKEGQFTKMKSAT